MFDQIKSGNLLEPFGNLLGTFWEPFENQKVPKRFPDFEIFKSLKKGSQKVPTFGGSQKGSQKVPKFLRYFSDFGEKRFPGTFWIFAQTETRVGTVF